MTCEVLKNPYFVMLLYIINFAKHILNYKIVKIDPHFLYFFSRGGGGGTGMRKEDGEKKWKSENA